MIGLFDSGIGGLTVVKEFLKQLPRYRLLYFGDTARLPYGPKGKETIFQYSIENTEFLLKKGAKIIVIACNSASTAADQLKNKFPKVPIFSVIEPAVQKAIEVTRVKRVGVIGTRATIGSGLYEKLIAEKDPAIKVFSKACPLLVALAEEGWLNKPETKRIIKRYLHPLRLQQIDALILACTHYPLFKDLIQPRIGRRVILVDPAQEAAGQVKNFLLAHPEVEKLLAKDDKHEFYASDITPHFSEIATKWLGRKVELKKAF